MPEAHAAPPVPDEMRAIVEALVFAAEEPLTLGDLADLFPSASRETLQQTLDDVVAYWEGNERGLQVLRVAGGYRMTTRPELGEWVRALFRSRNRRRLSPAALETLAIVAYRQPVTTPEIQALRGTDPGGVLQTLLDRRLLRVVGRKKVVGKPLLYGTTQEFLTHFGLNSLTDLPTLEEFGAVAAQLAAQPRSEPVAMAPLDDDDDETDPQYEDTTEDEGERDDDGDDS
jgi:segregation and condensation protein B